MASAPKIAETPYPKPTYIIIIENPKIIAFVIPFALFALWCKERNRHWNHWENTWS